MEGQGTVMEKTTLTPAVLAFLERDRIATLNLVGILRNEPGTELLVDDAEHPRGVLAKGPWFWYVHTEDEAFLEALFRELEQKDGFYQFSGVWRPLAERIKERYPLVWDAPCDLYHLPPGNHRPELARTPAQSVDLRDAEIIDEHYAYRHARSLDKIRKCIQHRNSSAIYVEGQLVSWLLVHEDGSMGIMYTLEDHRRKGYAVDVTVDLVGRQLAAGLTPFIQIRNDNDMSPGLARKCGFVRHGSCDWFGIMVGTPRELIEGGIEFRRRIVASVPDPLQRREPILDPDRELACLCRFLNPLQPEENPVVETEDEEAWLACASRHFDGETLRMFLANLRESYRLLWECQDGPVAALLLDDDDGAELLWCSSREEDFLRYALLRAKTMGVSAVFVHTPSEEMDAYEQMGFLKAYAEDVSK